MVKPIMSTITKVGKSVLLQQTSQLFGVIFKEINLDFVTLEILIP